MVAMDNVDPLILKDVVAWRAWLDENEETSDGVWLLVAKKYHRADFAYGCRCSSGSLVQWMVR